MSLLFSKGLSPLFDNEPVVPSAGGEPSGGGELTRDEMIDYLNADDDEKDDVLPLDTTPPKKAGKKEGEEGDEVEPDDDDELKDIEEELEPPKDIDDLELVTPVRRREILAKYPNLFKDFPYLEKAYYREQQFTEIFPTLDDAKSAMNAKQTLNNFEQDVMQGNITTILKAIKQESPDGFNSLADNYMLALREADESAYYHVLANVSKSTIVAMVQEAKRADNDTLMTAAQILNQFLFASSDFTPPTRLSKNDPKDTGKENELNMRERQFVAQQFEATRTDLDTKVGNTLRNTINAHIDPKNSMTEYVRKKASEDALSYLQEQIGRDSRFQSVNDKLWERAFQSRFSPADVAKIKSAYLARAKSLLPAVIRRARQEALKGMSGRSGEETTTHKGPVTPGRPRSQEPSGKITKPQDIPKGMKTLDFLMQD